MRILVAAATAFVMLAAASASAQSLEKTYADLCSDPANARSESCVALAQALVAKLQGQGAVASGATPAKPTIADAPAGSAVVVDAAPATADLGAIWGIYARLIGVTLATGKNGPPSSWRWGEGDEIIQDHVGIAFRKIRRGAAVGELVLLEGRNFDQVWKGTVGADGSVVFVPAKEASWLLREPSRRIRQVGDVVLVEEVKLKDGQVVGASESFRYYGKISDAVPPGTTPDSRPAPVEAVIATSSTGPGTGTKQDPIPLALGQKVAGRLDDNSPRSGIMRSRSAFYRLAGRQGQTVVVGLDCDVHAFYACIYTAAVPEKTLGYQLELADSPVLHAWRVTLKADNPLLHVYSNGTVEYAVVVQDGAAGEALWAEAKSARARSDAAFAQQKRERSAERGALFGAVLQGLAQGTAEASYEQQQSQATQDAMLAQVQQQTMQIQQAHAQAAAQQQSDAESQRRALEQAQAQQVAAGQQRPAQVETSSAGGTSAATTAEPVQAAAAKPLRFVLSISLRNRPGDTVNPSCYSNVITRPGPPGWGAPGFLPPGSGEQARQTVYSLKSDFIAACRASGREVTSEGNFNFFSNQSQYDEQRLQEVGARYREDVSVTLN